MATEEKQNISTWLTQKRAMHPKYVAFIGALLTLLYAFGVPALDLRYKISGVIGGYFLDAYRSTDTFDHYLYFILFVPLILLSLIWAYGIYQQIRHSRNRYARSNAIIVAVGVPILSLALYFAMDIAFGFHYHFVF